MKRLLVVMIFAFSSTVFAQTGELWFNYGESLINSKSLGTDQAFSTATNDVQLDNGYRFSFRFGFNQGDHFGHEVQYAFNHTALQFNDQGGAKESMHFHQGGYNFLYYLTTDKLRIRPFVTAGVMFDDFVPPGGGINYGSSNKFGANVGAGVKFHIKGMFAGRVDAREYVSGKPSFGLFNTTGAFWQTELSAGVGVGF